MVRWFLYGLVLYDVASGCSQRAHIACEVAIVNKRTVDNNRSGASGMEYPRSAVARGRNQNATALSLLNDF